MKTLSVKLPAPLARWLAQRSKDFGRTQSDVVREALEQQKDGSRPRGRKSCGELMADLEGFFEGPPDLSTNPRYLADFGK